MMLMTISYKPPPGREIPKTVLTGYNRNGNTSVMDLNTYVRREGGTARRGCPVLGVIAEKAGCSPETLYMIAVGHKTPGPKLAGRISDATASAVPRHDLRPDIFTPPAAGEGKDAA